MSKKRLPKVDAQYESIVYSIGNIYLHLNLHLLIDLDLDLDLNLNLNLDQSLL